VGARKKINFCKVLGTTQFIQKVINDMIGEFFFDCEFVECTKIETHVPSELFFSAMTVNFSKSQPSFSLSTFSVKFKCQTQFQHCFSICYSSVSASAHSGVSASAYATAWCFSICSQQCFNISICYSLVFQHILSIVFQHKLQRCFSISYSGVSA
jgi:hypothetical protein